MWFSIIVLCTHHNILSGQSLHVWGPCKCTPELAMLIFLPSRTVQKPRWNDSRHTNTTSSQSRLCDRETKPQLDLLVWPYEGDKRRWQTEDQKQSLCCSKKSCWSSSLCGTYAWPNHSISILQLDLELLTSHTPTTTVPKSFLPRCNLISNSRESSMRIRMPGGNQKMLLAVGDSKITVTSTIWNDPLCCDSNLHYSKTTEQ